MAIWTRASLGIIGRDLRRVHPEDALRRPKALGPELVAVAYEQGAAELARVGNPLQKINGDEGFPEPVARARSVPLFAPGDLFDDRPDSGILVIAARRFSPDVADE